MIFVNEKCDRNLKGIYMIINKLNGKAYIGKTEDRFIERYWNHKWKLKEKRHENKHLERSWNKYGAGNFEFHVIHRLQESEDINELEKMYIEHYSSNKNGYNMTLGGEGAPGFYLDENARRVIGEKNRIHGIGRKASEATKQKMSKSSKRLSPSKKTLETLRRIHTGKILSESTKQKLREANTGSKSPAAKLNEKQVEEIKSKFMAGAKQRGIAEEYNVSLEAIASIYYGRSWVHVEVDGWPDFVERKKNRVPKKTLTVAEVREVKDLLVQNISAPQIAKRFGIHSSTVYCIKLGKTHKQVVDNPVPSF